MYALRVFGGASLEGPAGPLAGRVSQRRPLALLALLAAAPQGQLSRDKLVGYLWPESDSEHARHLLSATLHVVRRALGDDSVRAPGSDLSLDTSVVWTDAAAFEQALNAGDPERAVDLYAGPFLDGFHLHGSGEFDRWAELERERLARAYAEALETLAFRAEAEGDARRAVDWWLRLAAHDPYSSRVAVHLMRAFEAAGDRAEALRHARVHRALLRQEFDAAPDPEVDALAERLRRADSGVLPDLDTGAADRVHAASPTPAPSGTEVAHAGASPAPTGRTPASGGPPAADGSGVGRRTRISRRARLYTIGVTMAAVGLAAAAWAAWHQADPGLPLEPAVTAPRIAVLPFAYHGRAELAYIGDGMMDLLSASLDGAGMLRSADPNAVRRYAAREISGVLGPEEGFAVAARFRTPLFVLGDIVEVAGTLRMTAYLYDGRIAREPVHQATAQGPVQELFRLVDALTVGLLADRMDVAGRRLSRTAAITTSSLPALKAYLRGESAYRDGRYDEAIQAFRYAIEADSSFALAHYRLSIAADWAGDYSLATRAIERALRHQEKLPGYERLLLRALFAWNRGSPSEAESFYRAALARRPNDAEAWNRLGETLFHLNPIRGRSVDEAREVFGRVLALTPSHRDAQVHLALLAAKAGRDDELRARAETLLRGTPPDAWRWRLLPAFASGDKAARDGALASLQQSSDDVLFDAAIELATYANHLDGAERVARLLTAASRAPEARVAGHLARAYFALARGRVSDALAELAAVRSLDPAAARTFRGLFATLPFLPIDSAALETIRDSLGAASGSVVTWRNPYFSLYGSFPAARYLSGLISARLGDEAAALDAADALERAEGTRDARVQGRILGAAIRARVAWLRGDPEATLEALEATRIENYPDDFVPRSEYWLHGYERHLRPRALAALGRDREAVQWLEARPWFSGSAERPLLDLVYAAPSQLLLAEVHERLGQPQAAARNYARFIQLWSECDPELRYLVEGAQRDLARMRGDIARGYTDHDNP